ncbi:hypothetical protein ACOME3_009257 [Neoechinorhynchus agilis]
MYKLDEFIKGLLRLDCLKDHKRYCMFLNTDYTFQPQFTALGCIYFVADSLNSVELYNFNDGKFEIFQDCLIYSGSLVDIPYIYTEKFKPAFFPLVKWSRKGFAVTKWKFDNTILNFINVHLFHDVSNVVAARKDPSVYSRYRHAALTYILNQTTTQDSEPKFIFGDFNFRTNTNRLLMDLFNASPCNSEVMEGRIIMRRYVESGEIAAFIGKKDFNLRLNGYNMFVRDGQQIKDYDREVDSFKGILFEVEHSFFATYPYSEDLAKPRDFMITRCPSWCDRVLMNAEGFRILSQEGLRHYDVVGADASMGDHKPVYLGATLKARVFVTKNDLNPVLILNGVRLKHIDGNDWNVHHYAPFTDTRAILSTELLKLLCIKVQETCSQENDPPRIKASARWAQIRAVSFFIGSQIHRKGSWYTCESSCASPVGTSESVCTKSRHSDCFLELEDRNQNQINLLIGTNEDHDYDDGDPNSAIQFKPQLVEINEERKPGTRSTQNKRRRPFTRRTFCGLQECCIV